MAYRDAWLSSITEEGLATDIARYECRKNRIGIPFPSTQLKANRYGEYKNIKMIDASTFFDNFLI